MGNITEQLLLSMTGLTEAQLALLKREIEWSRCYHHLRRISIHHYELVSNRIPAETGDLCVNGRLLSRRSSGGWQVLQLDTDDPQVIMTTLICYLTQPKHFKDLWAKHGDCLEVRQSGANKGGSQ